MCVYVDINDYKCINWESSIVLSVCFSSGSLNDAYLQSKMDEHICKVAWKLFCAHQGTVSHLQKDNVQRAYPPNTVGGKQRTHVELRSLLALFLIDPHCIAGSNVWSSNETNKNLSVPNWGTRPSSEECWIFQSGSWGPEIQKFWVGQAIGPTHSVCKNFGLEQRMMALSRYQPRIQKTCRSGVGFHMNAVPESCYNNVGLLTVSHLLFIRFRTAHKALQWFTYHWNSSCPLKPNNA